MARSVLIEELHLSWYVPSGLRDAECVAIRRTLTNVRFRVALRTAVQSVIRRYPALRHVRLKLSQ